MHPRTFVIAAALITLGGAAFAQDPVGNDDLPSTQSAPSPHDDTAFGENAQDQASDASDQFQMDKFYGANDHSAVARQFDKALDEYKKGKLDDAAKDLSAVVKTDPKNTQAQKVLAYTYLRQNKATDALPYLEASIISDPKDVQMRDNLGRIYLAMKRPADAAGQFKAVLAMSPKDQTATKGLAIAQAPKVKTTVTALTQTATGGKPPKDDDKSADDYMKMGDQLLKDKKFDAGMDAYNKAAALDPKNAELPLFIGQQYMQAGQADKAIPALNQALALNTKHSFEAHTMLGELYAPTDKDKAVVAFKAATQDKPKDPGSWYNLGVLEQQIGDNAGARHAFQKTLDLNPSDPALADHAKQDMASLPSQ